MISVHLEAQPSQAKLSVRVEHLVGVLFLYQFTYNGENRKIDSDSLLPPYCHLGKKKEKKRKKKRIEIIYSSQLQCPASLGQVWAEMTLALSPSQLLL